MLETTARDLALAVRRRHYQEDKLNISAKQRLRHRANRSRILASARKRREKNREVYNKHCYDRRLKALLIKVGLGFEEYRDRLGEIGGVCEICSGAVSGRLCIDHDHATGKFRGLLCQKCNKILGQWNDSVALFKAAITYLSRGVDA